jgi:rod shape determining protein RodA
LIIAAAILIAFGLACLFSEGIHNKDGGAFFRKQLINLGLGIVPFALFAVSSPKAWMRAWPVLYAINLVSLLAVLLHGSAKNGSARWIEIGSVQFQPSEMAKIFTVITLASFYVMRREEINKLSTFLLGLLHVSVPIVLIFLQPHTGAAMVICVVWLAVSLAAQVPFRFLGPTCLAGVLLLGALVLFPEKFPMLIHPYQLKRMKQMHGFQTTQAKIALGSGGIVGAGFCKGEVIKNIPEVENDFVFTIAGEELGLVGCTLILAAYAFLFYRIWLVMLHATEPFYRMLVTGILGILVFHTIVNLSMITGILPVIGLWLPFMSYGGTALWLCMTCVAIVLNVRRRERPILF